MFFKLLLYAHKARQSGIGLALTNRAEVSHYNHDSPLSSIGHSQEIPSTSIRISVTIITPKHNLRTDHFSKLKKKKKKKHEKKNTKKTKKKVK